MVWNVRDRFSGDRWRHCQWREISSGQLWHTQNHVRLVKNLPASFTYTIWISLAMPAFLLTFKLKVNDIFGKINLVTVWYRIPTSSFSTIERSTVNNLTMKWSRNFLHQTVSESIQDSMLKAEGCHALPAWSTTSRKIELSASWWENKKVQPVPFSFAIRTITGLEMF